MPTFAVTSGSATVVARATGVVVVMAAVEMVTAELRFSCLCAYTKTVTLCAVVNVTAQGLIKNDPIDTIMPSTTVVTAERKIDKEWTPLF